MEEIQNEEKDGPVETGRHIFKPKVSSKPARPERSPRPHTIANYFLVSGVDWRQALERGPFSELDLLDSEFCSSLPIKIQDRYPRVDYSDMSVDTQLVLFCFPIGIEIKNATLDSSAKTYVSSHSFTMTDEDHSKMYASCLTFF
mmetsp:Transcript_11109/g.23840  ORF Transcript_11109/g.23840 Transcript_11109/m.23840 type:complete len:144 (-) Transcript_11109:8461-8892(-)